MRYPAIQNLGVLAAKTQRRATDLHPTFSNSLAYRAQRYEQAQQEMKDWEPYPLTDVLEEGPNTSELPPVVSGSIWQGVRYALLGEFAVGAIVALSIYLWRTL